MVFSAGCGVVLDRVVAGQVFVYLKQQQQNFQSFGFFLKKKKDLYIYIYIYIYVWGGSRGKRGSKRYNEMFS